ncbi:MAG: LamG domain-containing protein [Ignavibacteriae bacterium]|nr:LamG domain-containing protein [Ignavibacteriota bacterium]
MKRKVLFFFLCMILAGLFSCKEKDFSNPVDSKVELKVPRLDSVSMLADTAVRLKIYDPNSYSNNSKISITYEIEQATPNASAFVVTYLSVPTSNFQNTFTTTVNGNYHVDSTYYFRVRIAIDKNKSKYSNIVTMSAGLKEYQPDSYTIALWHMNETSGTLVNDASGNGYSGTATGTTIVNGKFGKARSFNGTSDKIYIGDPASIYNLTNQITVEAWIYPDEFISGSSRQIFSTGQENNFVLNLRPQNKVSVFICNYDIHAELISASSYSPNQWIHIACTYDGATIKLYIEGNLDTTMNYSALMNCAQRGGGRNMVTIGAYTWFAGTGDFFKGKIDEVRISNKARAPSEFNVR